MLRVVHASHVLFMPRTPRTSALHASLALHMVYTRLNMCNSDITGFQSASSGLLPVDLPLLGMFFHCLHTCTYHFATESDIRHSLAFRRIYLSSAGMFGLMRTLSKGCIMMKKGI